MTDSSSPQPIVSLTRREHFCAAHRLWSAELPAADNHAFYGPCAREHGHGHNYYLEVTLRGPLDPVTGVVVNLRDVKEALAELIIDHVDQRHLNLDSPLCKDINPTAENLAVLFWRVLQPRFGALLHEVKIFETEKNWASYRGD